MKLRQAIISALAVSACSQLATAGAEEPDAEAVEELGAVLALDPRPARGARIARACASCHGSDATGSPDGTVPSLAGQHYRYLAKQVVEFRDEQRVAGPVHREMTLTVLNGPRDIADVAAYLAELPPATQPRTGPGRLVELGESLYRAACESCHTNAAVGNDSLGIPSLHGQHYPYLQQQLRDLASGHRFNAPPELTLLMKDMTPDDVEAIADYLSRLPSAGSLVTRSGPG